MAAKFFTGLPLDGPDPECVKGNGEFGLADVEPGSTPKSSLDHSHRTTRKPRPVPVSIAPRPPDHGIPDRACDENPLAGFSPR